MNRNRVRPHARRSLARRLAACTYVVCGFAAKPFLGAGTKRGDCVRIIYRSHTTFSMLRVEARSLIALQDCEDSIKWRPLLAGSQTEWLLLPARCTAHAKLREPQASAIIAVGRLLLFGRSVVRSSHALQGLYRARAGPRFGEFFLLLLASLACLLACCIHATWGPTFQPNSVPNRRQRNRTHRS